MARDSRRGGLMIYRFTIDGTMPNMNDFIQAERTQFRSRTGKFMTKGSQLKKRWQKTAVTFIRKDLKGTKVNTPIDIHYHYFEPNKRRDKGNIHGFAQKIIEDALQEAGTIPNDGWNEIRNFSTEFDVDKANPRIEVVLKEVGR